MLVILDYSFEIPQFDFFQSPMVMFYDLTSPRTRQAAPFGSRFTHACSIINVRLILLSRFPDFEGFRPNGLPQLESFRPFNLHSLITRLGRIEPVGA